MSSHAPTGAATATSAATRTFIGVDVGINSVAVAAPADGQPTDALEIAGEYVKTTFSEFQSASHRWALAGDYDDVSLGDVVSRYWSLLRAALEDAADRVVEYARGHSAPVLALEELSHDPLPLYACVCGNERVSAWVPATFQAILAERAVDAGVPVTYVDPHNTSQECHRCGELGELEAHRLVCTTEDCRVGDVCRDRSAALTIASRVE